MKITNDMLREWGVCVWGYKFFMRHFPNGEAEYKDVLKVMKASSEPQKFDYDWLEQKVGTVSNTKN
ncbi:MAG: hypothetical protein LBE50_03100 [Gallionellaceae bacterium]|jgi:hypothetical protein|nr:hypothetical protein [Gallionellaceae bacterium]